MALLAIKYSDHQYYQALCKAGCTEKLAEVHTKHQAEVAAMMNQENELIKDNIQHLEIAVIKTQQQITALDERMKHGFEKADQKITALDEKIDHKITSLDQKTQSSIRELAISSKLAVNELQHAIESISNKLFLRLSGVIVVVVGLFHSLHSFI